MPEPKEYEYVHPANSLNLHTVVPNDNRRAELRVLRAVEWAERNGIRVNAVAKSFSANDYNSCGPYLATYVDAIEALRAKVEPTAYDQLRTKVQKLLSEPRYQDRVKVEPEYSPEVLDALRRLEIEETVDPTDFTIIEDMESRVKGAPIKTSPIPAVAQESADPWSALEAKEATSILEEEMVPAVKPWQLCDLCAHNKAVRLIDEPSAGARLYLCRECDGFEMDTIRALRECRELGLSFTQTPSGRCIVVHHSAGTLKKFDRDTLPEALAAWKAEQRPKAQWFWVRMMQPNGEHVWEPLKYRNGHWYRAGYDIAVDQENIGPECPPPPEEV
jgi:hypothetical protein